jgi:Na+/H+ antiporter 1/Transposase DDE domain/Transposase domain (DUF772)
LPLGALIALVWVNTAPESYSAFTSAMSFAVNDVAMVLFFALMTKEVVEATAPGGVLHPWRRALLPVCASIGAAAVPALMYVRIVDAFDEPRLSIGWPVSLSMDLAIAYFIARLIFRTHPVIPFLLLLGIASDAIGFLALAVFNQTREVHLASGALIMAGAIGIAAGLRWSRVRSLLPYLLAAGSVSWVGFFWIGLHPALALVPIMPLSTSRCTRSGVLRRCTPQRERYIESIRAVVEVTWPGGAVLFWTRQCTWRAADSFALREFLGLVLPEAPPDHSTISRTRRLIDLETHEAVFTWILQRLADAGLVNGKTIGIDATTLEANAALRSIVRRDTGATYQEFLTQLARASGSDTPTREDLARIDRKRPKKGSNDDWTHPLDPDAKITKMKDGRTHLAHKAEHAVDLETGAVVAVTVQDANEGDTATSIETLIEAAEQVETVVADGEIKEVVADKGYHSNQVMVDLEAVGVRSYISEPDRGHRNWKDNPEARDAVYRNRRRIRGARASGSYGNAASGWNVRAPTSTKQVGCVECTCGVTTIFANGCWCMSVG